MKSHAEVGNNKQHTMTPCNRFSWQVTPVIYNCSIRCHPIWWGHWSTPSFSAIVHWIFPLLRQRTCTSKTFCFSWTHTSHTAWLICQYFLTWLQHHITITTLNITVIFSLGNTAPYLLFFIWCEFYTQFLVTDSIFTGTDVVIDTRWTFCHHSSSGWTGSGVALHHAHAGW